jgi:hypothetical protein
LKVSEALLKAELIFVMGSSGGASIKQRCFTAARPTVARAGTFPA